MWSVAVDVWIGNAAAVLSGCWGAVTRRAHETGLSRTSIYHHAHRVEQAVVHEQAGGISYETLWAEHERLRTENEALWEAWAAAEGVPEAKQQAFAATGSAMGLSLRQIITLLAIFLPNGTGPSRATVGRWVSQASRQAGVLLAALDQLCQRWVLALCLDEIFFHREPILMAVEPHSLAWLAGQRGPDRSGESWGDLMAKWPFVERVVADAGKGIGRGVKLANEARANEAQESAAARPIEMGSTSFIPNTSSSASCMGHGGGPSSSERPRRRRMPKSHAANTVDVMPVGWRSRRGGHGARRSSGSRRRCTPKRQPRRWRRCWPSCAPTDVAATGQGRQGTSARLWQHCTDRNGARAGGCCVIRGPSTISLGGISHCPRPLRNRCCARRHPVGGSGGKRWRSRRGQSGSPSRRWW